MQVNVFQDRKTMGRAAANDVSSCIKQLLKEKDEVNMIFAAAPSQDDFLRHLVKEPSISWDRINAFHMDEYIGLDKDAPQAFGNFLKERIFGKVPFKSVHYIDGTTSDPEGECNRYGDKLKQYKVDIVCLGIGENGHIAFNDPPVADFNDPYPVKIVNLDHASRQQQVNDKCFRHLEEVPQKAFTLTIPSLLKADYLFCIVPTKLKAEAIRNTLKNPISEVCPATILRTKNNAFLYLEKESASLIDL